MIKSRPHLKSAVTQSMLTGPRAMFELIETARGVMRPEHALARLGRENSRNEKRRRAKGMKPMASGKVRSLADQVYAGFRLCVNQIINPLRRGGYIIKIEGDDYPRWTLTEFGREYAIRMMQREARGIKTDFTHRTRKSC